MGDLEGRVALVTGAGQGAGMGIAQALAAAGAAVAVVGRTQSKLDAVVAGIERAGGRASAVQFDVADGDAMAATVERVARPFGTVDMPVDHALHDAPRGTAPAR